MSDHLSTTARDEIAEIIGRYAHTIRPITEIHRDPPRGTHRMTDHLFKPAVETLAAQLGDIADTTSAKLIELSRDPTPERCELAQHHLRGLQQYIAQLREAARQQTA